MAQSFDLERDVGSERPPVALEHVFVCLILFSERKSSEERQSTRIFSTHKIIGVGRVRDNTCQPKLAEPARRFLIDT